MFNPLFCIGLVDSAADLHASFPCFQRLFRCGVVAGAEHYDVGACKVVLLVEVGVVCGGVFGGPIRFEDVGRGGVEGAADDLLDAAGVQVYTGTEACHCACN